MTDQQLIETTRLFLRSLTRWPDESPSGTLREMHDALCEPQTDGVGGLLLLFVAVNGDAWPPMSPQAFEKGLTDQREPLILKFAHTIAERRLEDASPERKVQIL